MWTPGQGKVNWFPPYMTNNLVIKIPGNTDFLPPELQIF